MPSEHESRFYPRIFALVTAAILGIAVWRILQPFVGAILWSILVESSHPPPLRLKH